MKTIPFQVARALFPAEHRFIELDGALIHYVDEAAGETLLLLHGNPAWSFLYQKIIAGLRTSFRCVALDFPGYGMSDASPGYGFTPKEHSTVLERFVDRLGLKDLTIMVQDWGGPIGFGLAGRRPEIVRASSSATRSRGPSMTCSVTASSAHSWAGRSAAP